MAYQNPNNQTNTLISIAPNHYYRDNFHTIFASDNAFDPTNGGNHADLHRQAMSGGVD